MSDRTLKMLAYAVLLAAWSPRPFFTMKRQSSKSLAFMILAAALVFLAVAALIRDIVDPDVPAGTPSAQTGFQIGTVIGIVIRTALLGGLALFLHAKARLEKIPGGKAAEDHAEHRRIDDLQGL